MIATRNGGELKNCQKEERRGNKREGGREEEEERRGKRERKREEIGGASRNTIGSILPEDIVAMETLVSKEHRNINGMTGDLRQRKRRERGIARKGR